MQGTSLVPSAKAPAIPRTLEFDSQRKLDLALSIQDFRVDLRIDRLFHEWPDVTCSRGGRGRLTAAENLGVEMRTGGKVWMVDDVEEFGAKLQHAGLSQES